MSEELAQAYLDESRATIEGFYAEDYAAIRQARQAGLLEYNDYIKALDNAWNKRLRLMSDAWECYCNRIGI